MKKRPNMSPHCLKDWCHLCGERTITNVDISYPENAEHPEASDKSKYLRICIGCAADIIRMFYIDRGAR